MNRVTFITWIRAARLRTIPLSISGILVGSAVSTFRKTILMPVYLYLLFSQRFVINCFPILPMIMAMVSRGTDNDERLGPKRILQSEQISRAKLRQAIFIISGLAVLLTILLVYSAFGLSKTALSFSRIGLFCYCCCHSIHCWLQRIWL